MTTSHDPPIRSSRLERVFQSPGHAAILCLLVLAAVYLAVRQLDHLSPALPYLILLACPLMHLLMHGSHGRHGSHATHGSEQERDHE